MEATGLFSVLDKMQNKNWIVIKSVCNFADGHKSDNKMESQTFAAQNAVDFCFHFFKTEMPSNIIGYKRTQKNYKESIHDVTINGYLLFMAKNNNCTSFKLLANKTRIPECTLKEFERITSINDVPVFHKPTYNNYIKIQKALDFEVEFSDEFVDENMKHFF